MSEQRHFGVQFGPKDVRDYKAVCTSTNVEYPKEFARWRPHIKNQQNEETCVAHVISSIAEFFNHEQEGTDKSFSTEWSYGDRSDYFGEGMFADDALKNFVRTGDCYEELFPGNNNAKTAIANYKAKMLELFPDAYPHRISSYFVVFGEDLMKSCLMQYGLLMICVNWRKGTEVDEDGILHFHTETKVEGGHCMYIYGWNEIGWLVANSWGAEWGKNGCCIIPYEEIIRSIYGVTDDIRSKSAQDKQLKLYQNQIKELQTKNKELQSIVQNNAEEILKLSDEISELSLKLFSFQTQNSELVNNKEELEKSIETVRTELNQKITQVDNLRVEMDNYKTQKDEYTEKLKEYEKTIKSLETQLVEIEQPFSTKFGQVIAKILNWFIRLFRGSKT